MYRPNTASAPGALGVRRKLNKSHRICLTMAVVSGIIGLIGSGMTVVLLYLFIHEMIWGMWIPMFLVGVWGVNTGFGAYKLLGLAYQLHMKSSYLKRIGHLIPKVMTPIPELDIEALANVQRLDKIGAEFYTGPTEDAIERYSSEDDD